MPEKEHLKGNDSTLAIEEVIRILNREKQRKDNLESKASSLLNAVTIVITILISVIGFILSTSAVNNPTFFSFYIVGIVMLTITMILLLLVLRTKSYTYPFQTENIDEIRFNMRHDPFKLEKLIIKEYTKCFIIAYSNNNNKVRVLKFAEFSLTLGTILVIISIIILITLKMTMLI